MSWVVWSLLLSWLLLGCQVLFGTVEVNRGGGLGVQCSVGDVRCNNEYLLSCGAKDTGWSLKDTCASDDLCNAKGKRCSVCKDGDFRCAGAARQQCAADGGSWLTVETCAAENVCSESTCNGCTREGELDCSVAPLLRRCQAGVWVTLDQCGSLALCQATTAYVTTATAWDQKCVAPGCPTAGQYRCEGAILERCPPEQDAWAKVDTCANSVLCENAAVAVNTASDPNAVAVLDMCKPGCPNAGAFLCDGATLKQCRADQVGYDVIKVCPSGTECDPAGDCGQLCKEGQYQCNGETLRKCDNTGHWKDSVKCASAALCSVAADASTGRCTPSPCGANYVCKGAILQKCRDDRTGYDNTLECPSAALCDAPSSRCLDPGCSTAGAYRCSDQVLQRCPSDLTAWETITTCAAGQYCDNGAKPGCLTTCPANPVRCNDKVLEHCSAATGWTTQATCQTADLCKCALVDPDGAGPRTNSCLLGLFQDGCGNVACGGIKPNYQCQGAQLQKCQAGRNGWDYVAECGVPNLCYPGEAPTYAGGYCLTCPVAGELACNGSALRVCSSDRRTWNSSQTCVNGCNPVQNGQDYCAACNAGTVQCAGAILQSCPTDERAWTSTTCNSAALCDKTNNQCDLCTQTTCAGNVLKKCTNGGQTLQNQTCASVCDAANAQCDKCAASNVWCDGATLNKCSADGQTQTSTNCPTPGLCDAMNGVCTAPACSVGETKCTGAQPQICNADRTGFISAGPACASAALCNPGSGTCSEPICAVGERSCGGPGMNVLQICNAGRKTWDTVGTCATSALCDPSKPACVAPACDVGAITCSGAQPQICNPGRTGYASMGPVCASGCSGGLCNGCSANHKTCDGAQPQICAADLSGFINNGPACMGVACNVATGTCNACIANQKKCSGAQPQICSANLATFMSNGPPCATAALCDPTTFTCNDPACAPGEHKCLGSNSQICNTDQTGFVDGTECGAAGCNPTTNRCNTVVCVPGKFQCVNLDLQQCNGSGTAWNPLETCSAICDSLQGECDECLAPAFNCMGSLLQTCSVTGHWQTFLDCSLLPTSTCNPVGLCE